MKQAAGDEVLLRRATPDDADLLAAWDHEPRVIACSTDDPEAEIAFDGIEWRNELADQSDVNVYFIAEVAGRPIGVMQVIDPYTEPTHYWGDIEPGLRAIDIWIGPRDALGLGYGTQMMTRVIDDCFADPAVDAIVIDPLASDIRAHRFYQRLGFRPVGSRLFEDDHCLIHRLDRTDWLSRPR